MRSSRVLALTALAMVAFASNSLLCRIALKHTVIDAASFTLVRILSGAIVLWLIVKLRQSFAGATVPENNSQSLGGTWPSALALFAYAAAFSFAYNTLPAGTGALLLFGAVQATMIFWGIRNGERLHSRQLVGLIMALGGLILLVLPGLSAPPLVGSILMLAAGVAWGIYSLFGKGETNPVGATAGNFLRAVPLAVVVSALSYPWARLDPSGISYAVLSGAIASGLGYVIWYSALPGLKATSAATVQLSVPVLTATGGILLLSEPMTWRYLWASAAILGGIALVVASRSHAPATSKTGS